MKMKVLEDHSKRAISYKLWVFLKILFYKPSVVRESVVVLSVHERNSLHSESS
jgi:hypothetical protein